MRSRASPAVSGAVRCVARAYTHAVTGEIAILVNGEPCAVSAGASLADLLGKFSLAPQRVAVELNQRLVRRGDFAATPLAPNDRVEIVTFVGGG